jgi:hypothetical protein
VKVDFCGEGSYSGRQGADLVGGLVEQSIMIEKYKCVTGNIMHKRLSDSIDCICSQGRDSWYKSSSNGYLPSQ